MPRAHRQVDATPDPATLLHQKAHTVFDSLLQALEEASRRLASAAAGNSVFTSDHDLKATLELLKVLPHLLRHLPPPPKTPPPVYQIPLIPKCPICRRGPGAHWPEDCPKRKP